MSFRPRHLSVSSVGLYTRCPAQYRQRYVDKMVTPTTAPQATGKAFHAALEAEHRGQDSERAWIAAWNAADADLAASGQQPVMSKSHGLDLLNLYRSLGYGGMKGEPERKFMLPFPSRNIPVPLLGFLDAVLPEEIREYKTSGSAWWTEARAKTSEQAAVYGWAHTQIYHRRVPIRYIIFRTDTLAVQDFLVPYSPEIFRVFEQMAELTWAGIVAGEYTGCGVCPELCKPPVRREPKGPSFAWDDQP